MLSFFVVFEANKQFLYLCYELIWLIDLFLLLMWPRSGRALSAVKLIGLTWQVTLSELWCRSCWWNERYNSTSVEINLLVGHSFRVIKQKQKILYFVEGLLYELDLQGQFHKILSTNVQSVLWYHVDVREIRSDSLVQIIKFTAGKKDRI